MNHADRVVDGVILHKCRVLHGFHIGYYLPSKKPLTEKLKTEKPSGISDGVIASGGSHVSLFATLPQKESRIKTNRDAVRRKNKFEKLNTRDK
jgi:hypothetical protein